MQVMERIPYGGTDCALPMIWAKDQLKNKVQVEAFHVYTDNETWYGKVHPHVALDRYRKASGIQAKSIVVGFTATEFTVADPKDPGQMDIVGFDSAAPAVMADFVRGGSTTTEIEEDDSLE
jgi:60 kDa SS-A/Ro ribonucleoprotein